MIGRVTESPSWPHRARTTVRYHECDMQKVVFNAHYLTYCDEAMGSWLAAVFGQFDDHFDWMLVRIELDWRGSATFGDVIDIDVGVERWGTTSFTTRFLGSVRDRTIFEARITYVCVRPGTTTKMEVPPDVRAGLALAPSSS
jgi:acyl-CoA thioester hydrolase